MGGRVVYILLLFALKWNFTKTYGQTLSPTHQSNFNESLQNITNNNNKTDMLQKANDLKICKTKTCIYKCCPQNKYVLYQRGIKTCAEYSKNFTFDFNGLNLYDKDKTRVLTTVGLSNNTHLIDQIT